MCPCPNLSGCDILFPMIPDGRSNEGEKKCFTMAAVFFATALAVFALDYCLFHYLGADGSFTAVFHTDPPYITFCVGIWGVLRFGAVLISAMAGVIFFPEGVIR